MLVIAHHQLGFPGMVTNNYRILKNPRELAAIIETRLTIFAIEGVGGDPLRATGAVLLDLPGALKKLGTRKGKVFWMRPPNPTPEDPRFCLIVPQSIRTDSLPTSSPSSEFPPRNSEPTCSTEPLGVAAT